MIAYYDMISGEWYSADAAAPASRTDTGYVPPAPTTQLMHVLENVDTIPRKRDLPSDIATLPVSMILAQWT